MTPTASKKQSREALQQLTADFNAGREDEELVNALWELHDAGDYGAATEYQQGFLTQGEVARRYQNVVHPKPNLANWDIGIG